jgi:two-component system LytT family response regulator
MNLLIVDDEPSARIGLRRLCEQAPDMRVVGEAGTGATAIEAVEQLRPDLMFLDADLPDMSGFDVLHALRRRHQRRTILITANAQDAPSAFAAGALDFLVKPVNEQALSTSILRARARAVARLAPARRLQMPTLKEPPRASSAERPLYLVGEREHRLYPLDVLDIDYVQSTGNYVTFHLGGVEYIARDSIKRLNSVLAPAGFVRIERSLLLSIRAIAYAQPVGHGSFVFTLASGARLHSGHAYRDTILAALPLRRRPPSAISASR